MHDWTRHGPIVVLCSWACWPTKNNTHTHKLQLKLGAIMSARIYLYTKWKILAYWPNIYKQVNNKNIICLFPIICFFFFFLQMPNFISSCWLYLTSSKHGIRLNTINKIQFWHHTEVSACPFQRPMLLREIIPAFYENQIAYTNRNLCAKCRLIKS
jgi:hypothetical protein